MRELLIATGNLGKYSEIKESLTDLPLKILSLTDLGLLNDCEETGQTYEQNALLKAEYFYRHLSGSQIVLADDSGIVVEALAGELGVYTRRWGAGEKVSDQQWLDYFMARMSKEQNRKAQFVSYVAIKSENVLEVFVGEVHGYITENVEGQIKPGLPIGAVFKPEGFDKVFSNMTLEDRMKISHRGLAVAKAKQYIAEQLL